MQAVEFETEIINDTICIPQEYKGSLPRKVRIIIMDNLFSNPYIIHTKKKKAVASSDFESIKIDTSKFKFNRDEANER
ncbi:MAG: hypothetical protein LBH25_14320 [Fibromonadaceae bacterium]|jgi:hypothetical protein|nr:hypothetical protein [Fibromonadaceae bacterium]